MINLSNETDYKLIFKTKNLYNFFFLLTIVLFIGVFLKISILSLQEKNSPLDELNNINSKIFSPTIYDTAGNRLAYSDYNFSIFKDKNIFEYLERDASNNKIRETLFIGNPNIKFEKILTRKHPFDKILSNTLGQVDIDHKGVSLIEKTLQKNNEDLILGIDINIQKKVFEVLNEEIKFLNPDYGLNVIVDLSKEEIISNVFIDSRDEKFDDSLMPIKDLLFEFGSVFKPFTVYSALKNKKIDLNEFFDVDQPVFIGAKLINDYPRNSSSPLQVKDILKSSSNRGAILIRRTLDCEKEFKDDFSNLGLLENVSVGLNLLSKVPEINNFRGSYCDNYPYGYGMAISPIQLINAYGKIVTGRDTFMATFEKKSIVKSNEFNSVSTSINKLLFYANETSEELYKNFLVAGKTGTADISDKSSQNVTYISYFPYNNPKYLSLTFMSNPKNKYGPYMTAGNTVKPVFFNILKEIYVNLDLSILDIKGTDI